MCAFRAAWKSSNGILAQSIFIRLPSSRASWVLNSSFGCMCIFYYSRRNGVVDFVLVHDIFEPIEFLAETGEVFGNMKDVSFDGKEGFVGFVDIGFFFDF